MGPYKSLCVFKDSNVSLWVIIVLFAYLWILMGPYRSLFDLTDSNGSLLVLIDYLLESIRTNKDL